MPLLTTLRAYYAATIDEFLGASADSVIGALTTRSNYSVDPPQRDAWLGEIEILRQSLTGIPGAIFLEFEVPRIGSRIDAVIITGPLIAVVEFKVGERKINLADYNQAWDYALDLKNFHRASHHARILPVLVATEIDAVPLSIAPPADDGVHRPTTCNAAGLRSVIESASSSLAGTPIDPSDWVASPYQPTPTIIEAAQALYARHSVEAIAASEAGENLTITSVRVEDIIDEARTSGKKAIVFVTGVPGAGKTLVGLNIATRRSGEQDPAHAVCLSGNGPLVKVLTEALARDEMARIKRANGTARKGHVVQKIKPFIQNVHHFRDEGLKHIGAPSDRVVIFDEAQRAWDRAMTSDFMRRKKGRPGFSQSEPEVLLSYLDRHPDWAVVICLVGGGQEINRGEAGISAWLDAVATSFNSWTAYISPQLVDSEYDAGHAVTHLAGRAKLVEDPSLHLAVSMRSFRAENVSRFVKAAMRRRYWQTPCKDTQ